VLERMVGFESGKVKNESILEKEVGVGEITAEQGGDRRRVSP